MAQDQAKQLTTEQQKNQDTIDGINAKVNACAADWGQFEDLCWQTLRNMGLYLYVGAVDPGTKKVIIVTNLQGMMSTFCSIKIAVNISTHLS